MSDPSHAPCRYALDATDRIVRVDDAWLSFARENGASRLTREAVVGRPIWDFVAGAETRHLYELLYERVRTARSTITVPFRCDSADRFRFMQLALAPADSDGIDCEGILLREQSRTYFPLLDGVLPHMDYSYPMCSLCKKIFVFGGWSAPEEAVARLDMFDSTRPPRLEYDVCDGCRRAAAPLEEHERGPAA